MDKKLTPAQITALRHLADAPSNADALGVSVNTLWALSTRKLAHPSQKPGIGFFPRLHPWHITAAGRDVVASAQ